MFSRYTKALDSIKALRKDRVAELKAEKERLESLSREKQHADKLRARISDLTATITTKEVEYEQTKKDYEGLVKSNAQFYDYSTKFREMYLKIENLQERKSHYQSELEDAKENTQEVVGKLDVIWS
jgi:chromosome segregation ATPase